MSWQAYIDQLLEGGNVRRACICGLGDGQPWATSAGVGVTPDEAKDLVKGLDDHALVYANGVHVEGKRYTVVSAGDHELHAKSGAAGVLVARTCLALVIAFYDAEQRAESCNATLLALTDYLRSCSY